MTAQHTPGALEIFGDDALAGDIPVIELSIGECPSLQFKSVAYINCSTDKDDEFVLTDEDRSNAARIVHTWNCHDDLLEALERLVLESVAPDGLPYEDGESIALDKARAAIAKARGGSYERFVERMEAQVEGREYKPEVA